MGQGDVLKFMEDNKTKWLTSLEVGKELGVSQGNASRCLNTLESQKLIISKKYKNKGEPWRIRYKLNSLNGN